MFYGTESFAQLQSSLNACPIFFRLAKHANCKFVFEIWVSLTRVFAIARVFRNQRLSKARHPFSFRALDCLAKLAYIYIYIRNRWWRSLRNRIRSKGHARMWSRGIRNLERQDVGKFRHIVYSARKMSTIFRLAQQICRRHFSAQIIDSR